MKLWTHARILSRGLARRLLARWQRPEDTLAYVLDQLQQAANRHKLHLAELIVEHQKGERQLAALSVEGGESAALRERLAQQVAAQRHRISQGRATLVELGAQIVQLKAKRGDVRLRADLLAAQGALRDLLGDLGAPSVPGLIDQIDQELAEREQVQWVLEHLDTLSEGRRPEPPQAPGLEPRG